LRDGRPCLAIDVAFGKGGQLAVRGLLLLQILFEQPGAIRTPELLDPRDQGALTRHLVVLDRLSRGDQCRVKHVLVVDLSPATSSACVPALDKKSISKGN
jgi:hypothetical protein